MQTHTHLHPNSRGFVDPAPQTLGVHGSPVAVNACLSLQPIFASFHLGTCELHGDPSAARGPVGCVGTRWLRGDLSAVQGPVSCVETRWLCGDPSAVWRPVGCMGTRVWSAVFTAVSPAPETTPGS